MGQIVNKSWLRSVIVVWLSCLLPAISYASITSALLNKQLDTQQNLKLDTTLPEAMQQIGNQTGVRLEADPDVWELLPWGEQTTIKANIQNCTLRQGLAAITRKLALECVLGDESVQLRPMPALRRLGRRATLDELIVLDKMSTAPISLATDHPLLGQIVSAENDQLTKLKSSFAVDDLAAEAARQQQISVPRNATLADALEAMSEQTDTTWYPWGKTIVLVSKAEQVRTQLNKIINARYSGVEVSQVVLELLQRAGVNFTVQPGAYSKIPAQFTNIQLMLDQASVQQALESISGYTGLTFDVSSKGVHVSYPGVDLTSPATRSAVQR